MNKNYWLVRGKWDGIDQIEKFVNNDEWVNGYDDKYFDIVKRVGEKDILLLSLDSEIIYYSECIDNKLDGKTIQVDKWEKFQTPIYCQAKGNYIKTITNIKNDKIINEVKNCIYKQEQIKNLILKSISLKNFTLFENEKLEFSKGLNVIVGENSSCKTLLLKLLYTLIKSNNITSLANLKSISSKLLEKNFQNIFKMDKLSNLIKKKESQSLIKLDLNQYNINFEIENLIKIQDLENHDYYQKNAVFLPAKEILSFLEGFISIYHSTSFDETFYDLAMLMGKLLPSNRQVTSIDKINKILERLLNGKIETMNGRFYLNSNGEKTEITLIAEGLKKIGTLSYLIANKSLDKNSILFWDEPETNLNPKYIKFIAEVLLELEKTGVQLFISTHDLFLIKEIEILRNKHDIRYFSFGLKDEKLIVSQDETFEYLDNLVLLDEELEQSDRFMDKNYDCE